MVEVPVKKYRTRRAKKWLRRKLVPFSVRAGKVARKWNKPDRHDWPLDAQNDAPGLDRYEYSWLSQNGEDGILRYLFNEIGFESRWFVEFGFGAHQCNSLRLIMHEDFSGLLIDGSPEDVDFCNFAIREHGVADRVTAVQAFITRDNLAGLITSSGVPRDIDFLSVDVDGNDYWFWQALECVNPRVVCAEYNAGMGPDVAWTSPYDAEFERFAAHPSGFFYGSSLAALELLAKFKGYYLIGCETSGTNAFFLRDDIRIEGLPALTASEAYRPNANWLHRGLTEAEQFEIARSMPYVDVSVDANGMIRE